jgi:hypothetical protein
MRRKFVCLEQTSNGVTDTALMKKLEHEEHKDRMEMEGQNIHRKKNIESYESMMLKHTNLQEQPTRRRLHIQETCSMDMHLNQINAVPVRQAKHMHLVNKNTLPEGANYDHFKMPLVVLDKLLHEAGAGLNKFDLINIQKTTLQKMEDVVLEE